MKRHRGAANVGRTESSAPRIGNASKERRRIALGHFAGGWLSFGRASARERLIELEQLVGDAPQCAPLPLAR